MKRFVLSFAAMTAALALGVGVAFAQTLVGDGADNRLVGTPKPTS
jgi:hypothetical protein